jgi:hypothetical protein
MDATFDQLVEFLTGLGTEQVAHTDGTFLAHLIGVYRDLQGWGCDEAICRAGMFHSIYGTERFSRFALPLDQRSEVRRLIGERAERLAYLNCAMDRPSFDAAVENVSGPHRIVDRFTQRTIDLSVEDYDDLCRVHLCDWLEQVPRCRQWDYRRAAYVRMAEKLGGPALVAYERVFGKQPLAAG